MNRPGFTLIDFIVVMVILGILATVAMPKFSDLTESAKVSNAKNSLQAIRSSVTLEYADNIQAGNPTYPAQVTGAYFRSGRVPMNALNKNSQVGNVAAPPAGTATHATDGFWYIAATGEVGAYSNGSVDTSGW